MASHMVDMESYAIKIESPPEPSPRNSVSYRERVKHLLTNIPPTPSIIKGPLLDDEKTLFESSRTMSFARSMSSRRTTSSTRTATEPPSQTSTAATSMELLPLVFVIQKFHVSPNMPIDEKIKTIWTRQIKSRLTGVLLHSIPTGTCVPEFMMVGKKANALKPSVVITCGDAGTKKRVEKSFKSQVWLQELLKANGIMFIALVAKTSLSAGPALDPPETIRLNECCAMLIGDSGGTSCGQLLLINGSNTQPQRHCTLGGLLVVKGKVLGLTAGHAFDAVAKQESPQLEYDIAQDVDPSEEEEGSDTSSEPFIFNGDDDDDEDDDNYSNISTDSSESHASICPTPISSLMYGQNVPTTESTPSVTWSPLLNAIIPQSSSHDSQSSDEPPGECDWALLDILPRSIRMMPNKISRSDILVEKTISGLFHGKVAVLGAEIQAGYLHPSPVTMTVDKSVLHVRLLTLDHILPLGSSGAWVVLGEELCGFIIAIRQDVPWAYMMPIEPVIEDIKMRFDTSDVRLPRRGEIDTLVTSSSADEPPEQSTSPLSMSNNSPITSAEHSNQPSDGQQVEILNEKSSSPESSAGAEARIPPAPLSESCDPNADPLGSSSDAEKSLLSSDDNNLPIADASSEPTPSSPVNAFLLWIGYTVRFMLSRTSLKLYEVWQWLEIHILQRAIRGILSGFYYICWIFTAVYNSLLQFFNDFYLYFQGGIGTQTIGPDGEMSGSRRTRIGALLERYRSTQLVLQYRHENRDVERGSVSPWPTITESV